MNILSIDDDDEFNMLLKKKLPIDEGTNLYITKDAHSFYSSYERINPDILIVDINIGGQKAGKEIIGKMRSKKTIKQVPILVLSQAKKSREVEEYFKMGADDFVPKPLDEKMLRKKLELLYYLKTYLY